MWIGRFNNLDIAAISKLSAQASSYNASKY